MEQLAPQNLLQRLRRHTLDDATLELLASALDDIFRILGTPFRSGLDPLIGLVPGLGDAITGLASFLIVFAGWQRRLRKITLLRMVTNIAIDTLLGTIPVAGDIFDVVWKSNRMNLRLLQRARSDPDHKKTWRDWLFLGFLISVIVALAIAPFLVLLWLIHLLRK